MAAILIKDAGVRDARLIASALLACANVEGTSPTTTQQGEHTDKHDGSHLLITATLWLDRLRHFHLAKTIPENAHAITQSLYNQLLAAQNPLALLLGKYAAEKQ